MGIDVIIINLVIAIPVFILSLLFWKRFVKDKNYRLILTINTTIFLTPITYVGIFLIWVYTVSYYPNKEFDKELWLKMEDKRYELVNDLIKNEKLIGKNKIEVIELLGDDYNEIENSINYYIGYEPSILGIDPSILIVEFENNIVVRVTKRRT